MASFKIDGFTYPWKLRNVKSLTESLSTGTQTDGQTNKSNYIVLLKRGTIDDEIVVISEIEFVMSQPELQDARLETSMSSNLIL